MSLDANMESCRVCHQEGSPHRPLFQPCQCDGSMRHVHQDCLVAWLRHSGRRSCEVCNQPFSFNGGHKNSATDQGATIQTIITGVKQALMIAGTSFCAMFFLILGWFVWMPLGTVNAIAHYFGYNLGYFFMPMTILKGVLGGLVITGFTIVVVVSIGLLRQFLKNQNLIRLKFHKSTGPDPEATNEGLTKEESDRFFDSVIGEMMLPSGKDYNKIAYHMTPAEKESLESVRDILVKCTYAEQKHFLARYRIVSYRKVEWETLKKEAEARGEPYPDFEAYLGTFKAVAEGREDPDHPYHGTEGWKSIDFADPQKLLFALTQPSFCREVRCNRCHSCLCLDVDHTYRCSEITDGITQKKLANALAMGMTREQFALQLCEFRRLRFLGKAIVFQDITTPVTPNAPILSSSNAPRQIHAYPINHPSIATPLAIVNTMCATATPSQIRQYAQTFLPKTPAPVLPLVFKFDLDRLFGCHGLNLMAPLNATVIAIVNVLIVLLLVAWPHSIATSIMNLISMTYALLISSPTINTLLSKLLSLTDALPSSTATIALDVYHWINPIASSMAYTLASILPLRVIFGHLAIASLVKSYLSITARFRTRQQLIPFEDFFIQHCFVYLNALKLVILFTIELIAQPFFVGLMMDISMLPITGGTIGERVSQANSHPILFSLFHVAAGWAGLKAEYTFLAQMRGFFREGLLYRLRNPKDPNRVLVKEMIQSSFLENIWGFTLFVIRHIMIVGMFLAAPVAVMVEVMPTLLPMTIPIIAPSSMNQLPIEALLQLVAKHFGDVLYALLFVGTVPWVVKMLARSLRLSSFLFGGRFAQEENLASGGRYVFVPASNIRYPAKIAEMMASREVTPLEVAHMGEGGKRRDSSAGSSANKASFCVVYQPSWFMVRFGLLMTLTWLWICALGVAAFMSSLVGGRMLWSMAGGVADDSKAFALGTIALTLALKTMVYLLRLVPSIPFRRCLNGLGMAFKLTIFGAIVAIAWPLLLGSWALLAIHLIISQADASILPAAIIINSWSLGVVLLYFGYQFRRVFVAEANCRRLELALDWRSWPNRSFTSTFLRIMAPLTTKLFLGLYLPGLVGMVMCNMPDLQIIMFFAPLCMPAWSALKASTCGLRDNIVEGHRKAMKIKNF